MGLASHRILGPILVLAVVGGLTSVALSTTNPTPTEPPLSPATPVGEPLSQGMEDDATQSPGEEDPSFVGDGDDRGSGRACTSPNGRLNFKTSWTGPEFRGLPLTAVIRECESTVSEGSTRTNFVSYLYGSCDPEPEGCAVPIEIQTWPTESRSHSMYHPKGVSSALLLPHEDTVFDGIPALVAEYRLELFFPDVTVVIFGHDEATRKEFARSLRPGVGVLTQLTEFGVSFEPKCADQFGHCEGIRSASGGDAG
jgi:hypothetical protein